MTGLQLSMDPRSVYRVSIGSTLRVGSVSVSDFLELQGGVAGKGERCWPCPRCEGGLVRMVRHIPRLKAVAVPRVSFLACLIQWMKTDRFL